MTRQKIKCSPKSACNIFLRMQTRRGSWCTAAVCNKTGETTTLTIFRLRMLKTTLFIPLIYARHVHTYLITLICCAKPRKTIGNAKEPPSKCSRGSATNKYGCEGGCPPKAGAVPKLSTYEYTKCTGKILKYYVPIKPKQWEVPKKSNLMVPWKI